MAYDFQNEADVKLYLDNLGTEYRFSCFSEKIPHSCQLLGEYLETIKNDYDKAMKVYRNNCEENKQAKSCLKFALLASKGKGPKMSRNEIFEFFEKACEYGDNEGCTTGGIIAMSNAMKPDKQEQADVLNDKGVKMVRRGCELDNSYGCYYISTMYISGSANLTKDMKQAFKYATKGCDLGCIYSCGNLSQMYTRGEGVEKDTTKGALLKAKTLDMLGQYEEKHVALQRQ